MTSQTTAEYAVAVAQPNLAVEPTSASRFAGYGEGLQLDLGELSHRAARQVCARLLSREFWDWADTVARVGNCAHPIKLRGSTQTIDPATVRCCRATTALTNRSGSPTSPAGTGGPVSVWPARGFTRRTCSI